MNGCLTRLSVECTCCTHTAHIFITFYDIPSPPLPSPFSPLSLSSPSLSSPPLPLPCHLPPRRYFGEKVGLYFTWIGHYTTWLIIATIIGILVMLYGVTTIYFPLRNPIA